MCFYRTFPGAWLVPFLLACLIAACEQDEIVRLDSDLNGWFSVIETRVSAAQALADHPDPRAVAVLLQGLESEHPPVLEAVIVALGRPGREAAVQPLLDYLAGDRREHRDAIMNSLVAIGDARALPVFEARLKLAMEALGDTSVKESVQQIRQFGLPALPLLTKVMRTPPRKSHRQILAEVLRTYSGPDDVESMRKLLDEPDGVIVATAAAALGDAADRSSVPALLGVLQRIPAVAQTVDELGPGNSILFFPRLSVIDALSRLDDPRAESELKRIAAPGHISRLEMFAAAEGVIRLGGEVPALVDAAGLLLTRSYNTSKMRKGTRLLVHGGTKGRALLIRYAAENQRFATLSTEMIQAHAASPGMRESLLEAMHAGDYRLRSFAVQQLDQAGFSPDAEQRLAYLFAKDDWKALAAAGPEGVSYLLKGLFRERRYAASHGRIEPGSANSPSRHLVAMGAPVVPVLIERYPDQPGPVREEVNRVLGEIGGPDSVAFLGKTLLEGECEGCVAALEAQGEPGIEEIGRVLVATGDNKRHLYQLARVLTQADNPKAMGFLIKRIKGQKQPSAHVLAALGDYGAKAAGATDLLINRIDQKTGRYSRDPAMVALAKIGGKKALKIHLRYLSHWYLAHSAITGLDVLDWRPKSPREQVLVNAARGKAGELKEEWAQTRKVLLAEVRSGSRQRIENAVYVFIGLGQEQSLADLKRTLDKHGTVIMAEVYLNCGHDALVAVAEAWAKRNGYQVQTRFGSSSGVRWGSL